MDENISSIVDTAEDINLCSNSRTFFGLSLIISIVSDDDAVVIVDDTLLCVLSSSKCKISNTQLTYRCHDIHSVPSLFEKIEKELILKYYD
jgi:hypothetical protein